MREPFIPPAEDPVVSQAGDWTLHAYQTVTSTNLVGAALPAWHAIRSESQTAGRGRFQRTWVSDQGGLWLSAVVPTGSAADAHCLPLVVGFSVCNLLSSLGVNQLRMRWPNDILAGDRKLAGLLIDQFQPGLAVAGIGINVYNNPEAADPGLANHTARLGGLISPCPSLAELTVLVLSSVRDAVQEVQSFGFAHLLPRINALWGGPRTVELDLDGTLRRGTFVGVDAHGRLLLAGTPAGLTTAFESHQVRHLQES